jgi:CRISPR/Cas system CSM-associated protein Csm3 (group 7 of RAMP superfamily)
METYIISIELLSDTTFGRGDGVAGLVDQEVVHDATGFPYLRGRTLKGLLSEECDNLGAVAAGKKDWNPALQRLFGSAGSTTGVAAHWYIGDACLPDDLRRVVAAQQNPDTLTAVMVLESLTAIRRQTAIMAETGAPETGSLRSARVVIRGLTFTSYVRTPVHHADDLMLLAAGCLALRHIGSGRNRGRGRVRCALNTSAGVDITHEQFRLFAEASA